MRIVLLITLLAALAGCSQERGYSAMIVFDGARTRDGVGTPVALSLREEKMVRQLESFFPDYASLPTSPLAGAWISGYDIYIDNERGRAVHIVVSYDGEFWTVGRGDLRVSGDFTRFVEQLQPRTRNSATRRSQGRRGADERSPMGKMPDAAVRETPVGLFG